MFLDDIVMNVAIGMILFCMIGFSGILYLGYSFVSMNKSKTEDVELHTHNPIDRDLMMG
ncbi:MAG: hypothetical protein Edafosvirus2_69 [Edafosvirus sp.]|uniref:Uncharacterized protein n=1 Tax=Edafosvirus sp. TaxID=2487765 RepID=A0A3G4ZSL3_9VIRU|nr:MAG: hypothetical protein Edafosvirus2_69 [Edafosvirus sp.]